MALRGTVPMTVSNTSTVQANTPPTIDCGEPETPLLHDAFRDSDVECALHHGDGALFGPVYADSDLSSGGEEAEAITSTAANGTHVQRPPLCSLGVRTEEHIAGRRPISPATQEAQAITSTADTAATLQRQAVCLLGPRTEEDIAGQREISDGQLPHWIPTGMPEPVLRAMLRTVPHSHGFHVLVQTAHAATWQQGKTIRALCHRHYRPDFTTSLGRRKTRTNGTGCKWKLLYEHSRCCTMVLRKACLAHNHPLFELNQRGDPTPAALAFHTVRNIPESLASMADFLKVGRQGPAAIDTVLVANAQSRGIAVTWTYADVKNRYAPALCDDMYAGSCTHVYTHVSTQQWCPDTRGVGPSAFLMRVEPVGNDDTVARQMGKMWRSRAHGRHPPLGLAGNTPGHRTTLLCCPPTPLRTVSYHASSQCILDHATWH
jgi:hypothetical protein